MPFLSKRRHTVSSPSGLEPSLRTAEYHNSHSTSHNHVLLSKHNRHKSVTFSDVDLVTDLSPTGSAGSNEWTFLSAPPPPSFDVVASRAIDLEPVPDISVAYSNDDDRNCRPISERRRRHHTVSVTILSPTSRVKIRLDSPISHARSLHLEHEHETDLECRRSPLRLHSHRGRRHTAAAAPSLKYCRSYNKEHSPRLEDVNHRYEPVLALANHSPSTSTSYTKRRFSEPQLFSTDRYTPIYSLQGSRPLKTGILPHRTSPLSRPHYPANRDRDSVHQRRSNTHIIRRLTFFTCEQNPHAECIALLEKSISSLIPSHFPILSTESAPFFISHAPKKGLGMFARRLIRQGETILVEHPLLITPYNGADGPVHSHKRSRSRQESGVSIEDMYEEMFDLLSERAKGALTDLAGFEVESGNRTNAYDTITRINPLAVTLPTPPKATASHKKTTTYQGIFLKTNRCNHSCGPNAKWSWSPASLTLTLTALRAINPGDEITITYIVPQRSFHQRRATLSQLFDFDCVCEQCLRVLTAEEGARTQSDNAREFLSVFWDSNNPSSSLLSFDKWYKNPSKYPDNDILISAHLRALQLIKQEGLEVLSSVRYPYPSCDYYPRTTHFDEFGLPCPHPTPNIILHTESIAVCYGALGDKSNFQKWIAKALDLRARSLVVGDDDGELTPRRVFEKWLRDPESFPIWGSRWNQSNGNDD